MRYVKKVSGRAFKSGLLIERVVREYSTLLGTALVLSDGSWIYESAVITVSCDIAAGVLQSVDQPKH